MAEVVKLFPADLHVLNYLKSGRALTPLKASEEVGVQSLAGCIHRLRHAGHQIRTEHRTSYRGKRYARYTLQSGVCDVGTGGENLVS
jgi:hypothetical protein